MPRTMPPLASRFCSSVDRAIELAREGEAARLTAPAVIRHLPVHRMEYLYEMAFLRLFLAWEVFLEDSFLRYLAGYSCALGQAPLAAGRAYAQHVSAARASLYGGRQYLLWHGPSIVVKRSRKYFNGGRHELVIQSNLSRIEAFAAIRHRVAHAQDDAMQKFNVATMGLVGRRYKGARPGRFLRDWHKHMVPRKRWVEVIGDELKGLAAQVTP